MKNDIMPFRFFLQTVFILALSSFAFTACSQTKNSSNSEQSNDIHAIGDYIEGKGYDKYEVATFAGGCFWCTEAAFERIQGVVDVISGYSGGEKAYPTYYEVGRGATNHAESIQIYYDPDVITFEKLLEVFFVAHDPTQLNRQGPDVGKEYRSAIFYHNEEQKEKVAEFIKAQTANFADQIVTEVSPYKEFWVAEAYHQDYYEHHPNEPYVRNVSRPKVEKVKKKFADILKPKYAKK